MYTCYLDGELLYHPDLDDYKIESTHLSMELNKTGSFKFTVRQQNTRYGFLKKKKSIVKVYNEDRRLFRGRVLNAKKGFYNQLQVTCEGELAFFLDSVVRPYTFKGSVEDYFHFLVNSHNAQMDDEERRFKIGRCTVTDPNDYIVRESSDYPKTLDEMKEKLVKLLGGYLWTREEADGIYIDYLEDFETMNEQTVDFAKNLLDFEEVVKGQDIVTAIIPLGAKLTDKEGNETEERLTIAGINDGVDYVYSPEAVEMYGLIFETVVWDDVTLPENLIRKGREKLQNHINLTRTIELKAVDLHHLNLDIRSFYLGNYTSVISEPHGFDEMMLTRKLDINLLDPADGFLVLGDEKITFVDKQVETSNKATQAVQIIEKVNSNYEINKAKVEKLLAELGEKDVVISPEEPEQKGLWCDTSSSPPVLKKWNSDLEDWEIVNDNAEQITQIYKELASSISQASDSILIQVGEKTYTKEETDRLISDTNTLLEQTKNAFNFEFNSFKKNLDDLASSTDARFENTSKYIRFIDGEIWIGVEGNPIMLRQRNDRISFLENNVEVAYISNRTLYFTHAEILKDLKIGRFGFVVMESGYVPFKLIG